MNKSRTIVEDAIDILKDIGAPIHYLELTNLLQQKRKISGKTPHLTVRSRIGSDKRFIRIAEGTYALSEWSGYSKARFAKEIAYDILDKLNSPISAEKLGEEIFKERTFQGNPRQVAINAIRSDKRFVINSDNDLIRLAKWKNQDINSNTYEKN